MKVSENFALPGLGGVKPRCFERRPHCRRPLVATNGLLAGDDTLLHGFDVQDQWPVVRTGD
jgi:hypothetical protein